MILSASTYYVHCLTRFDDLLDYLMWVAGITLHVLWETFFKRPEITYFSHRRMLCFSPWVDLGVMTVNIYSGSSGWWLSPTPHVYLFY